MAEQWPEVCREQIANLNLLFPEGGGTRPALPMNHTLPASSRSMERAWEGWGKERGFLRGGWGFWGRAGGDVAEALEGLG